MRQRELQRSFRGRTGACRGRRQLDMVHELAWDGENPELSHLTIELCKELTGANFVNSSPAGALIGDDGSTGLYASRIQTICRASGQHTGAAATINKPLALAQASFVPKAARTRISSDRGPSTNCEEIEPNPILLLVTPPCSSAIGAGVCCHDLRSDDNLLGCRITDGSGLCGRILGGGHFGVEAGLWHLLQTIGAWIPASRRAPNDLRRSFVRRRSSPVRGYSRLRCGWHHDATFVDGGFSPAPRRPGRTRSRQLPGAISCRSAT